MRMGCVDERHYRTRAMSVPRAGLLLLVGWFVLGISDAENLLDFQGNVFCWNDSLRITLPQLLEGFSWQELFIIDSEGEHKDCDYVVDHEHLQMTAYSNCMEYEGNSPHLTIQFIIDTDGYRKVTYEVTCDDVNDEPVSLSEEVTCNENFMSIPIPRTLAPVQDERAVSIVPLTWYVELTDGKRTYLWDTTEARQQGYRLTNDAERNNLLIQVSFNGTGLQVFKQDGHTLYFADIGLLYNLFNVRLRIDAQMICVPGPYACNKTHLTIMIPSFPGTLSAVNVNLKDIPMNQLSGVIVDTTNGIKLYIAKKILKNNCQPPQSFITTLKLTFDLNGNPIKMLIYPECPCLFLDSPSGPLCSEDGFMNFDVLASRTKPSLNLDTVRVLDGSCLPISKTKEKVSFHLPLKGCGTIHSHRGGVTVYENEVRALWEDLTPSIISRDSEFRLTVRCSYKDNVDAFVGAAVLTAMPLVTLARNQGPISLILNIFSDDSYRNSYTDSQFPVVKLLREPVYLEVKLLNRNDPNVELKLNNCWATASQDPTSMPRWNVVVDGCDYRNDNYRTLFHPVGSQVQYPSHHKRFEVKTFAFVSGDVSRSSLIYFHCTALVCNMLAPDSPLCSTRCPTSRRRRETALSYKENLVSLPGPVVFHQSEFSRNNEDPVVFSEDLVPANMNGAWSSGIVLAVLLCFVVLSSAILKCGNGSKYIMVTN